MTKLKMLIGAIAVIAFGSFAVAQSGFWPNWPIVSGSSYSCGSVNGVSNCTVAAGPTVITGLENIPANTNIAGGSSPQNVLISLRSLHALPITLVTGTISGNNVVASAATSGGVFLVGPAPISGATITLPVNPVDGQQWVFSSNRSITTLVITGANNVAPNTSPTAHTASLTAPQGYRFWYNTASALWYRLQ